MHEYDVTLKLILQDLNSQAARVLTGVKIERWLNVELPEIQQTRVDLLGETAEGELVHVELQSTNDRNMPVRMLEYSLRVYRQFGSFPRQILLYVGEPPLRMRSELVGERLRFSYDTVDIRELDGEALLGSSHLSDNVIAILTRLRDRRGAVRRILKKIAASAPEQRENAFKRLLILSGLRQSAKSVKYVEEEAKKMPVLNDILDHEVIGPAIRQGLEQGIEQGIELGIEQGIEQGIEKGIEQGLEQGRNEEALTMLRRLILKRFGVFPEWAAELLANQSSVQLEEIGERLFDVESVEELFHSARVR